MTQVRPDQLETLRQMQSCTIANAIETFEVKPRNEGFMSSEIRCMFPQLGGMIGYAATAVIAADSPPTSNMNVPRPDWFDQILEIPEPRVVVMHDLDAPNPVGSFWGEVQSNVHRRLGCVGTVTDGGVRDIDEMQELGFHAFASGVLVSHAYIHIVDVNVPVMVGGLKVSPRDIVMGDKHGVLTIPPEIAGSIPEAVEKIERKERAIIDLCNSADFDLDRLKELVGR